MECVESVTSDANLFRSFVERQDEAAFEELVRRHGSMVLRVCRDILHDPDSAEDAFQATFLILVSRARAIRDPEALGSWLHGVATRVSVRARVNLRRRESRERARHAMLSDESGRSHEPSEIEPALHVELRKLPPKYRDVLVKYYLEGHTQEEAARRLRVPLGTFKHRVERARELLRRRLTRRGLVLTGAALIALLGRRAEAVPEDLVQTTVNSGVVLARKGRRAECLSHRVERLMLDDRTRRRVRLGIALLVALLSPGLLLAASHEAAYLVPLIGHSMPAGSASELDFLGIFQAPWGNSGSAQTCH